VVASNRRALPETRLGKPSITVSGMEGVQAAGGVVLRDGRVAVVHRPKYDDWSLPKGKLDRGESFEDAALREVEEETGLRCRLVRELPAVEYEVRGRPKLVRYWAMEIEDETPFVPGDEVDEVRWLEPAEALALLSYDRDREPVLAL
jgi:8-oxo-dGTP pyrophosphatase MutT (NUDIX family)